MTLCTSAATLLCLGQWCRKDTCNERAEEEEGEREEWREGRKKGREERGSKKKGKVEQSGGGCRLAWKARRMCVIRRRRGMARINSACEDQWCLIKMGYWLQGC